MAVERLQPGTPSWRSWGHQHIQRYQFTRPWIEGRKVLDLACGAGFGSFSLCSLGAREVVGVDLDPESIAAARETYAHPRLSFIAADALTWEPGAGQRFEAAVSLETIEHLPDPSGFVARLAGSLEAEGYLVISAPNALQYSRAIHPIQNPYHLNEPDYPTLLAWLRPHFNVIGEFEQSPIIPEDGLRAYQLRLDHFERYSLIALMRRWEDSFRRLLGRSLPEIKQEPPLSSVIAFTDIWPLLPQRREQANVFVFVCRKKA